MTDNNVLAPAIIPSIQRIVNPGEAITFTARANGSSDPAGIRDALDRARHWVFARGSSLTINGLEGQFTETSPIVVDQDNASHIILAGTSITMASSGGAVQVASITKIATLKYDVVLQWFTSGLTSGVIVGNFIKIRAYAASTTGSGALRVRDLSGIWPITVVNSASKLVTIRVNLVKDLDALDTITIALTNIRVIRTVLQGSFTYNATRQGLFDVHSGIQLSGMCLYGGKTDTGTPSTGGPTADGVADTAGVVIRENAFFRALDHVGSYGWDYGVSNEGGEMYANDFAACFNANNAFYGQFGAVFKCFYATASGSNVGCAMFSGSLFTGTNAVFAGNTTNARSGDSSNIALDDDAWISAGVVGFNVADNGVITAAGADLTTTAGIAMGNTTLHTVTRYGRVMYDDAGTPVNATS